MSPTPSYHSLVLTLLMFVNLTNMFVKVRILQQNIFCTVFVNYIFVYLINILKKKNADAFFFFFANFVLYSLKYVACDWLEL